MQLVVVPTVLGDVVAHASERRGSTATLLLHGAAGSWATWQPLIEAARSGGQPLIDTVALDLPGWGGSGPLPKDADIASMTEAVSQVANTLGYASWNAVGHSLGGHLALDLAVRMPQQTNSVTLISATGPGAVAMLRHPLRRFTTLPWLAGMVVAMRMLTLFGRAATPLLRILHRSGLLRILAAPLFAGPVSREMSDALSREVRPKAFLLAARAAAAWDERSWSEVRCPVAVISGSRDVFVARGDAAWYTAHLPHASQSVIREAGHFAHVEHPERVFEVMRDVTDRGEG